MPLLLLESLQLDPESHLNPETRKTYLIPRYVHFSNDYQLLLLSDMWSLDASFFI